ncbi:hypothetical protein V8G54_035840 [Vigna mungo]|uniref:Uncharacterized protein n=1 Tax=Vigna mungo TaxID=3915 RepID=A0AAQ3RDQ6_VIGMU
MLVRFLSPPDMLLRYPPPIFVWRHLSRPSSLIVVSTLAYFCCSLILPGNLKNAEKINVSSTVSCGKSTSSCVTKPILLLTAALNRTSLYVIFPFTFSTNLPPTTLNKVVFPLPEGPIKARISPGPMLPVIPFKIFLYLSSPRLCCMATFDITDFTGLVEAAWLALTLYSTSSNLR